MSDQETEEKTKITGEEAYQIIQYFQAVADDRDTSTSSVTLDDSYRVGELVEPPRPTLPPKLLEKPI